MLNTVFCTHLELYNFHINILNIPCLDFQRLQDLHLEKLIKSVYEIINRSNLSFIPLLRCPSVSFHG